MPIAPPKCVLGAVAIATAILGVAPALADEFVEITIPLRDGCYYSPREVCNQCNQRLGTRFPLALIPDKEQKLTDGARKALLVASLTGVLPSTIDDHQLVVKAPNPQDDSTRRRNRALIERLFGISMDWPNGKGLHLPDDFRPDAHTILFVHGLESRAEQFDRFRQAARNWGVQALVFDYPNDGPIAWSGDRLSDDLKSLAAKYPTLRVAIVAHSMGGLLCRYSLETPGKQPSCVTDLFLLGAPNAGTSFSGIQPAMELFLETFSKDVPRWGTIQDGLGEAAADLRPDSEFLKALNARKRPVAGVTYHVVAGRKGLVPKSVLAAAQLAAAKVDNKDLRDPLVAILKSPEFQDGLGDGVVTIESALLTGVESRQTFELNHLQLVSLPGEPPEACEVFQWIMKILDWKKS
jgi:pimeloyl-ACP methyl ester carboxylesterase